MNKQWEYRITNFSSKFIKWIEKLTQEKNHNSVLSRSTYNLCSGHSLSTKL